jgi:hypothetical protein
MSQSGACADTYMVWPFVAMYVQLYLVCTVRNSFHNRQLKTQRLTPCNEEETPLSCALLG